MKQYPVFDGYLFLQDDTALNFWNLLEMDKNKIWLDPYPPYWDKAKFVDVSLSLNENPNYVLWGWWAPYWHANQRAWKQLPEWALKNLAKNFGKSSIFSKCFT